MSLRSVVRNAGWLGIVHVASYVLPVLTVPVVTHAFGPELYGIYALGIAYTSFVKLAVDYGFVWTMTKPVTAAADDAPRLSVIYSTVLAAQAVLSLAGAAIFIALLAGFDLGRGHPAMFLVLLLSNLFWALSPLWLFAGLQRMRELAISQLMARIIAAMATLALIRAPSDLLLYAAINLASNLMVFVDIHRRTRGLGIRLVRPPGGAVRRALSEARSPFLANMATTLYAYSAIIIVNAIVDARAAGIFAFADRIRALLVGLLSPLSLALFPFVSRIGGRAMTGQERSTKHRYAVLVLSTMTAAGLATFILAPRIVHFLGGDRFASAATLLRMMAVLPVLAAVKDLVGIQTLVAQGHLQAVSRIMLATALIGVPVVAALTRWQGIEGATTGLVLVDAAAAAWLGWRWQRARQSAPEALRADGSPA